MHVTIGNRRYDFHKVQLQLIENGIDNLFAKFHKMPLRQLVEHKKYAHLKALTLEKLDHLLDTPAGMALLSLKQKGDLFYQAFLNNYGDKSYARFTVKGNEYYLNRKGVYTIIVNNELVFCGVCARNFKERFNQHIGNISAKGCYRDGTATHCHLNARLSEVLGKEKVHFSICPMTDTKEMNQLKNSIIKRFEPSWNLKSGRESSNDLKLY